MKLDYLFKIVSLLIATSLISGCGTSGANNPPSVFNGAVFISDRETPLKNELYIVDSEATTVTKLSSGVLAGSVKSFLVSPNTGFIAYLADQEVVGEFELYYLKNNGNTSQSTGVPIKINPDISAPSESITDYQWSPNGLFVAYLSDPDGAGFQQLLISDAKTVIKVSPAVLTGDVTEIKWSPDSKSIAFKTLVTVNDEIHVSKADGSVIATQVSDSTIGAGPMDFEWSPDSSLIAYLSDQDNAGVVDLYTTADDVLLSTKVTDVTTGSVQAFRWPNLNSTLLAYSANPLVTNDVNLYITEPSNNTAIVVISAVTFGGGVTNDFLWAPDNSSIAYVADQTTSGVFELYTTLSDGTETGTKRSKDITGGGPGIDTTTTDDSFKWSPASNQLIYRAEDTVGVFELFTSTIDGVALTEGVKISGALVALGNVGSDFQVSPFGNAVTYIADQEDDEVFELYTTDLTGTITPIRVSDDLSGTQDVFQHAWSTDGTKVFYIADQTFDGVNDVYTNFISGTTSANLSNNSPATGSVIGALVDGLGVTENLASP